MAKLNKDRISKLLKAKHREPLKVPFYYAPPFLDEVRKDLQARLASSGGRPTVPEWKVVRKTRFSRETWEFLQALAEKWSTSGVAISPSQVASRIVEEACRSGRRRKASSA